MTLAQQIAKARADLRNAVDTATLVLWSDEIQHEVFNLDIPLFEKRATLSSTDDQTEYDVSTDVATDVRKIKEIFYELTNVTSPYDMDYDQKRIYKYRFFDFIQNDDKLYLTDDPDGKDLTVVYYRVPTSITAVSSTPELPERWRKGYYIGMMKMAADRQYKTPSGDWQQIWQMYLNELEGNNRVQNRGPNTVQPYNIFVR